MVVVIHERLPLSIELADLYVASKDPRGRVNGLSGSHTFMNILAQTMHAPVSRSASFLSSCGSVELARMAS